MRLHYLELGNRYTSPTANAPLNGKAVFVGQTGEITLCLDAEGCQRILHVLAEELVRQSKQLAVDLTAEVIEQANGGLLENKL